jgi:hypothetical protein
MADNITHREYWKEVKDVAESVLDGVWDQYPDCDDERQRDERLNDAVWETVDGHQWIIYTHYNPQVLQHASNPDAYAENYGELPTGEGYAGIMAKLAFAAFNEDVNNELWDLSRSRQDECEEREEEAEEEGGFRVR